MLARCSYTCTYFCTYEDCGSHVCDRKRVAPHNRKRVVPQYCLGQMGWCAFTWFSVRDTTCGTNLVFAKNVMLFFQKWCQFRKIDDAIHKTRDVIVSMCLGIVLGIYLGIELLAWMRYLNDHLNLTIPMVYLVCAFIGVVREFWPFQGSWSHFWLEKSLSAWYSLILLHFFVRFHTIHQTCDIIVSMCLGIILGIYLGFELLAWMRYRNDCLNLSIPMVYLVCAFVRVLRAFWPFQQSWSHFWLEKSLSAWNSLILLRFFVQFLFLPSLINLAASLENDLEEPWSFGHLRIFVQMAKVHCSILHSGYRYFLTLLSRRQHASSAHNCIALECPMGQLIHWHLVAGDKH